MHKLILFFIVTVAVISCGDHPGEMVQEIRYKQQAIENSMNTLGRENAYVYNEFYNKLNDAATKDKAEYWKTEIDSIKTCTENTNKFVDSIVSILKSGNTEPGKHACEKELVKTLLKEKKVSNRLYDSLKFHLAGLMSLNEETKYIFKEEKLLPVNTKGEVTTSSSFYNIFFKEKCVTEALYNISVFKNEILNLENRFITFINHKITDHRLIIK